MAKGMCKKHPEVKAVMRKDGVSTGKCADCLAEHGKKYGKGK